MSQSNSHQVPDGLAHFYDAVGRSIRLQFPAPKGPSFSLSNFFKSL